MEGFFTSVNDFFSRALSQPSYEDAFDEYIFELLAPIFQVFLAPIHFFVAPIFNAMVLVPFEEVVLPLFEEGISYSELFFVIIFFFTSLFFVVSFCLTGL